MHWLTKHFRDMKRQAMNPHLILAVAVLEIDPTDEPPPPAMPTGFYCGSRSKVDAMRLRVEAGVSIFHSLDCEQFGCYG